MEIESWLGESNKIGIDIWKKKYCYDNESFDEWLDRVSNCNADVKQLILGKKFLFGGRILANRGLDKKGVKCCLSNCFVCSPPKDNIESIFKTGADMARTFSYGGGVGIDISKLAPKGAKINNTAEETTGAVSFTDFYSMIAGLIGQKGRRAALMLSMSCEHPDLPDFIDAKTDINRITKANMSVRITDDFMRSVTRNEQFHQHFERPETKWVVDMDIPARKTFRKLCDNNYDYGEPGCLYWDTIRNWNLLSQYPNFEYAGVNPCITGDTLIYTSTGFYTISDLVREKNVRVRCLDENNKVIFGKAVKIWKTRENAQLVKVVFNGGSLRCTPDHLIYTLNRGYVSASQLTKDDILRKISDTSPVLDVIPLEETEDVYDMTVENYHNFFANGIVVHNCAEEPLPAGGACLLGSLNLAEFVHDGTFDMKEFEEAVKISVKALNEVLDEGIPLLPLEEQKKSAKEWRQIGLGIMGLADALIKCDMIYGSKESLDFCDRIGEAMIDSAVLESAMLSKIYGSFEKYNRDCLFDSPFFLYNVSEATQDVVRKWGLRNSQLLTIAPTGTLSTMLGVSGGIEPIFATHYDRTVKSLHDKDEVYKIYTPIVWDYMQKHNLKDDSELPSKFITAQNLFYKERVDMQAIWQTHIDASISSTINLPEDFPKDRVYDIYHYAWTKACKGITVFRDGCKRDSILTTKTEKKGEAEKSAPKKSEHIPTTKGEEHLTGTKRKLVTGCGNLHVVALYNDEGKLREVFLNKGSTGGCHNFMNGLSRMISLSAKNDVPLKEIVNQLNSCGVCPSYAVRSATHRDTSKGSCCPMAVGNALLDIQKEIDGKHKCSCKEGGCCKKTEPHTPSAKNPCPNCGQELVFSGGCNSCPSCGYSKCQ